MNRALAITTLALAVAAGTGSCVEVPRLDVPVAKTTWKMRDDPRPKGRWAKCVERRKKHLDARKRQRQARKRQRRCR